MKTVKTSLGRLGVMLLSLALCLTMLPSAALASDSSEDTSADTSVTEEEDTSTETEETTTSKKLTVGSDETYTTIQAAIDYIYEQEDQDGWSITVEKGTYTYFIVNQYISNLTITGESGATVDCSSGSIQLMGDTITLEGLTFTATNTAWSVPVIKDASSNAGIYYDSMVTIKDCAFKGNNAGCALWICRLNSTVQNCTFDGFNYAIEIINETSTAAKVDTGTTTGTIAIDGNTVTNCDFFLHYGVRSGITLVVTDNKVTGSKDKVCASLFAWEGKSITVKDNTFTYAAFGLQNATDGTSAKDFLNTNTFNYSYVVDDYYDYSTREDYSATYYAPTVPGKTPVWSVSTTGAGDMAGTVADALEGHENDNPLTFTTTDGEGDMVCMGLAYQALNLDYTEGKISLPGLEKKILTNEGEVDQDDVAADDKATFQLTSNVPSNLTEYIDYTYSSSGIAVGTVKSGATYTLTFHDKMDDELTLDTSSIVVKVGDTTLGGENYTVTTSGLTDDRTFEVSMDLLALYTNEIISESDFGTAEITVTYTATLSKEAVAGTYTNTAWVVYPDGESEKDTVEVDTYGLSIFKYDQAPVYNEDGSEEDPTGLSGAIFTLYSDEKCTVEVATLTSDGEGYATLDGLDAGTYYLKETAAPTGYVMSNTTVKIVLPDDADETTNVVSVNFANAAIPSTGGMGTTMYTVAGICIVMAAGLALVVTRKKREA